MSSAAKGVMAPAVAMVYQPARAVESFGLGEQSIRKLRYRPFRGLVHAYVGAIAPQPQLFVFISTDPWPSDGRFPLGELQRRYQRIHPQQRWYRSIERVGDSVLFLFNGRRFRLSVSQIIYPVVGPKQVALVVYELP